MAVCFFCYSSLLFSGEAFVSFCRRLICGYKDTTKKPFLKIIGCLRMTSRVFVGLSVCD